MRKTNYVISILTIAMFCLTAQAQFTSSAKPDDLVNQAFQNGRAFDSRGAVQMLQGLPDLSPEQQERNASALHQQLFNAVSRDKKRETMAAKSLAPLLQKLNLTNKISILILDDVQTPYVRLTGQGVLVTTMMLARPIDGKDRMGGYFLRELTRLAMSNEYATLLNAPTVKGLRRLDLSITAGATKLAIETGFPLADLRSAHLWYWGREKSSTTSTFPTDLQLFGRAARPTPAPATATKPSGGFKGILRQIVTPPPATSKGSNDDYKTDAGVITTGKLFSLEDIFWERYHLALMDDHIKVSAMIENAAQ